MLTVIGGPMFSGKTTWLLNYEKTLPKGTYELFKPDIDTRYAVHAYVNHNGEQLPAHNIAITHPHFPVEKHITTILLDELNFFNITTLLPAIQEQLHMGKDIVAAGLLYDFAHQPFGATIPLAKKADKFIELFAKCDRCGKKASESYRKTKATEQIVLGAQDIYGASCKRCWHILSHSMS